MMRIESRLSRHHNCKSSVSRHVIRGLPTIPGPLLLGRGGDFRLNGVSVENFTEGVVRERVSTSTLGV
jgi:hypothetical protein